MEPEVRAAVLHRGDATVRTVPHAPPRRRLCGFVGSVPDLGRVPRGAPCRSSPCRKAGERNRGGQAGEKGPALRVLRAFRDIGFGVRPVPVDSAHDAFPDPAGVCLRLQIDRRRIACIACGPRGEGGERRGVAGGGLHDSLRPRSCVRLPRRRHGRLCGRLRRLGGFALGGVRHGGPVQGASRCGGSRVVGRAVSRWALRLALRPRAAAFRDSRPADGGAGCDVVVRARGRRDARYRGCLPCIFCCTPWQRRRRGLWLGASAMRVVSAR